MFTIEIAGVRVGIDNRFCFIEKQCEPYLSAGAAEFCVRVSPAEIRLEREAAPERNFSEGRLESVCICKKVCRIMPHYGAFLLHSAAVSMNGSAYAFCAKRGVGKTTHAMLWERRFGAWILNGDKPLVRFDNGRPFVYGTPWTGKEGFGRNARAPLEAVCFISRARESSASELSSGDAALRLMENILFPFDSDGMVKTFVLADELLSSARFFELRCSLGPQAAEAACRAILGYLPAKR